MHYATNFNIPQKFSPRNAPFLPIHESFLPRKFPAIRYHADPVSTATVLLIGDELVVLLDL